MLLIKIDQDKDSPLFKQIMNQIINLIESGGLKSGTRLPSSRDLANQLKINRSTVYNAYQELWALGYVDSRPGSYSIVRKRKPINRVSNYPDTPPVYEKSWLSSAAKSCFARQIRHPANDLSNTSRQNHIDLTPMSLDPQLIPYKAYHTELNQAIRKNGSGLFGYGAPQGHQPLRQTISDRMALHGIVVSEKNILVTNGAQQALELIFKLFINKGTAVVVEAPTYSSAIPLFESYNPKLIPVPMDSEGLDLDQLKAVIKQHHPKLIYTMPNFHNPTGITTSQTHRETLLNLCEQHQVMLIEDGFEEEMKYFGKSVLPIKSMDQTNNVIYIGTFSKVLFPGLRIGWVAADSTTIQHLTALKKAGDISSSLIHQAALDQFCCNGSYDLHLKTIHREYRDRMQTAINASKRYLKGTDTSATQPLGGYTFWVTTRLDQNRESELMDKFKASGVLVSPGSQFFINPPDYTCFRISIAHRINDEIEKGIQIIGEVLKHNF